MSNPIRWFVARFWVFFPLLIAAVSFREFENVMSLERREIDILAGHQEVLVLLSSEVRGIAKAFKAHVDGGKDKQESGVPELRARISVLEAAVNQSPEKILIVPLLQKDVESLRKTSDAQIQAVKDSVSQSTDLMRWLMGLLIASFIPNIVKLLKSKSAE